MSYKIKAISDPITEGDTTYQEISPIVGEGRNTSISTYPWDFSFNEDDNTYTSSWNSGKHAGTFTQGNYLYNSVTDALSKWKNGNAGIPYFAVNTSSGIKYYKILSQRPVTQTTDEPTEAEKQITNTSTPAQRKAAPSKRSVTKQYTPITGEAANYLDHISGGVPYFTLPWGYTNDDFQTALQAVIQAYPEMKNKKQEVYEDTSTASQEPSKKPQKNITTTTEQEFRKVDGIPIEAGQKFQLYAYPHESVHFYGIHPDVYEKVLKQLRTQAHSSSNNTGLKQYVITPKPLQKVPIGGQVNDSIHHYINANMEDTPYRLPYVVNENIISPGDMYAFAPEAVDPSEVQNGKVNARFSTYVGEFPLATSDGKTVLVSPDSIAGFWEASQYYNGYNSKNFNVRTPSTQEILKTIQKNNPVQQSGASNSTSSRVRSAVSKVKSWFGFKQGGTINYLNYFK